MKILLYTANYAPELTGIGKYSGEMAEWLKRAGHDVRVVTGVPHYPEWKVADSHKGSWFSRETLNGVDVWRAPMWVPSRLSGRTRILHLLSFAVSSLPAMAAGVFWRPDLVLTVAPAVMCAPAGWMTARLCGGRAWLHVQDFEVDAAFRLGILKGDWRRTAAESAERWLLRRFDRVSTISQRMVERLRSKGVAPGKTVFFPNWVDVDSISALPCSGRLRAELGLTEGAVVALYSGSLGAKHGLMLLPEVARSLSHLTHLTFVICGDGVMKPALEAECEGMANVRLLPLKPAEELDELLRMADIHLLPQSAGAADLVMPSKLSGMFASGRPVVATSAPGTEISRVLRGRGIVVPPNDTAAFAAAIERLVHEEEERAAHGASAREYAEEHLSGDVVLSRLNEELLALRRAT